MTGFLKGFAGKRTVPRQSPPQSYSSHPERDQVVTLPRFENEIESLKLFLSNSPTPTTIVSIDLEIQFWNESFESLINLPSPGSAPVLRSLFREGDWGDFMRQVTSCTIEEQTVFATNVLGQSYREVPVKIEISRYHLSSGNKFLTFIFEVAEAEKSHRPLSLLERVYRAVDGPIDGYWEWDIDSGVMLYSPGFERMLGYEPGEFDTTVDEWKERVHPSDKLFVERELVDCIVGIKPHYRAEHRLRCKDGSYKWILDRGGLIRHQNGRPIKMVGLHTMLGCAQSDES